MQIRSSDYYKVILFKYVFLIGCNEKTDMEMKMLQVDAIKAIRARLEKYSSRKIVDFLINNIAKKKGEMILNATSKTELQKIVALKCPQNDGNMFVPDKYSVPEEEIIMWSETSLIAPLNSAGQKRYMELFQQLFPITAKDIFKQGG